MSIFDIFDLTTLNLDEQIITKLTQQNEYYLDFKKLKIVKRIVSKN